MLKRCINALNLLGDKTPVTLRWIKAHVDKIGNEKPTRLPGGVPLMREMITPS